jgi:rSAM/selenodomain-associated transferase 1
MTEYEAYRHATGRIIVFARAPVPGRVKTRLAQRLGGPGAAQLYKALLHDTLDMAVRARLAPVELHVAPDTGHPFIQALVARLSLVACAQRGADLGQRMQSALDAALTDSRFAVLIGSDCPVMTPQYLHQACRELETGSDVVLGPAEDGGYTLIGMRRCCPELFRDMPWGSEDVLRITRQRAQALQLRYAELATLWDVDTPADLQRWRDIHPSAPSHSKLRKAIP